MRVHPTLIPHRRLIANVDGVMNAVLVKGDAVGPTLYYGAGAGALPTASAVVADVVDLVRALTTDPHNRVPHLAFQPSELSDTPVLPIDEVETAYYLRMTRWIAPASWPASPASLARRASASRPSSKRSPPKARPMCP
jgi:homoserine dehydrogenase